MRIDRQLQQQLAQELCGILDGWTTNEVIGLLGLYPARVSELRRGNLARFSIGRLVRLIIDRGYDIEIAIRPSTPPRRIPHRATASVTRYDRFGRLAGPRPEP